MNCDECAALRAERDAWEDAAQEIAASYPMIAKALNFPADEVPDGAAIVAKIDTLCATVRELVEALEGQALLLSAQRNASDIVHSITSKFGTKTADQIMKDAHAAWLRALGKGDVT
jgi:hypothetical protein